MQIMDVLNWSAEHRAVSLIGDAEKLNHSGAIINCSETVQFINISDADNNTSPLTMTLLYTVFCGSATVIAALETARIAVDFCRSDYYLLESTVENRH